MKNDFGLASRRFLPIAASLLCASLAACGGVRYYAEAGHNDAYYSEIRAHHPDVTPVRLDVRFLNNNKLDAASTSIARDDVERVLNTLGTFKVTDDPQAANVLTIIVDGSYRHSQSSGVTLVASDVVNGHGGDGTIATHFQFHVTWSGGGQPERVATFEHGVMSTLGDNSFKPGDRGPYNTIHDAFSVVMEDVVLDFLKDLQDTGTAPLPTIYLPQANAN